MIVMDLDQFGYHAESLEVFHGMRFQDGIL
jgi:hypothetical protein